MVDHQIHDLLFGQTCFEAKVGEGQVVTGLRLIFEVLALALPGLLEALVGGHVPIEEIVGHGRVRVDGQRLVGKLLFPGLAGTFLLFGVRYSVVIEEFREVARIVTAVVLGVD